MSAEGSPSLKRDRFGFPIIPSMVEMYGQILQERRGLAIGYRRVWDSIHARNDISVDERDLLLMRTLTSREDTVAAIKLGLAKVIIDDYDGVMADYLDDEPTLSEMISFGIHWSWNGDREHQVNLSIDMYGWGSDGVLGSSGSVIDGSEQYAYLSPEDVGILAAIADRKVY